MAPPPSHFAKLEEEPKPEKLYTKYRSSRLRRSQPLRSGDEPPSDIRPESKPVGRRRPRRSRRRKIVLALLVLLALLLLAAAISFWRLDRAVAASNGKVDPQALKALAPYSGGPENILFIGSDKRPGDKASRADTLLIMRVDGGTKSISQLSIPRDSLTDIPGYGQGKVNSAYSYGGAALEIKVVEQLTGIPIHHVVEMDFSGFPAIVDSLGGVDINVPGTIDSKYPQGLSWTEVHFDKGPQHMDGNRALVYVRVRYSDDDFHRMARQQQFMQALEQKAASPWNIIQLPLIAPTIVDNMVTDMSMTDLLRLGWDKLRTPSGRNKKFVLAGAPQMIDGVDFVVLDENQNQQLLTDFLASTGGS